MHIYDSILHLTILLHFVFEELFFVLGVVDVDSFLVVAEVVQSTSFAHDNVLGCVFLVPVDYEEIQAHAKEAVHNFQTVEHFLDCVVVREIVD